MCYLDMVYLDHQFIITLPIYIHHFRVHPSATRHPIDHQAAAVRFQPADGNVGSAARTWDMSATTFLI